MAENFGPHVQEYYFRKLGLFTPQKIELSEKGQPITSSISRIRMMTMSFGHGIAVTPLQLVSAISTIVNGGYYIEPTLIKDRHTQEANNIVSDNKTIISPDTLSQWASDWRKHSNNNRPYFQKMKNVDLSSIKSVHGERLLSQEASDLTRYTMRLVCENGGSGTKADVYGFPVMGKTGTAEKASATGGYNKNARISSFAGVFPAHNPQYIVYTMVDEPKPNKKIGPFATAGYVAAPVIKEVVEHIAPLLNVEPIHYPITTPHAVSDNMLDNRYKNELRKTILR